MFPPGTLWSSKDNNENLERLVTRPRCTWTTKQGFNGFLVWQTYLLTRHCNPMDIHSQLSVFKGAGARNRHLRP